MNRFILIPLFLLITLISFIGCKENREKNSIVEFKNGCLTTEDLDAHYKKMKNSRAFKNRQEQLTPEVVFDHALNMEMIITKGLDEKLHLDPVIRAEIHEFMSNLFLKIMQDKLVPQINKKDFTEEELKKFYTKHKDNYKTKAKYSVKIIKTKDIESADKAIEQIKIGQSDFNGAVNKYSIDKKSKKQEGDIGTRTLAQFRKHWQPIISSLKTGKISGPHKIDNAYYVFKLVKKTKPYQYSFEEKKPYIKNDLLLVKYREEWQKTYDKLKKEYNVEINDKNLATYIKKRSK